MKEVLGLSVVGSILRVARMGSQGNSLHLQHLQELHLLGDSASASPRPDPSAQPNSAGPEPLDDIFGIEEDEAPAVGDQETTSEAEGDSLLDLPDADADDFEPPETNESLLNNVFTGFSTKKIDCAFNIPIGETVFHMLTDHNYGEIKKKQRDQIVREKLYTFYGESHRRVLSATEVQENGGLLIASIEEEPSFLRLLEGTEDLYPGKIFIQDILPEEMALLGLIRISHRFPADDISAIIYVGEKSSRIILLGGASIRTILPLVNEGRKSANVLNTLFSKILLELDQENIPKLDRIILANQKEVNGETFFANQFPNIEIESLQPVPENMEVDPAVDAKVDRYGNAIAAGVNITGQHRDAFPDLSLLPDYVRDRQKVLKLEWYGILLLILVGLTPIIFNFQYQQRSHETESLQQNITLASGQIAQLKPVKAVVDSMLAEYGEIDATLKQLETLSEGSIYWSRALGILGAGVNQVNRCWLTRLHYADNTIALEGISLYRDRVPRLASVFADAEIQEIQEEEFREVTLYRFRIRVNQVSDDPNAFDPEIQIKRLTGAE